MTQDATLAQLKHETELLAGYATDVVYRLRYNTMRYDYISPAAERLLGFTPAELMNMNFRSLILETRLVSEGMRAVASFDALEHNRKTGNTLKWQADYRVRTKDGRTIWVADVSYPWFDENGAMIGSIGSMRDITERVIAQNALHQALLASQHNDYETGLPNRHQFFERLDAELKRQLRSRTEVAVMVIASENLKDVQQQHGIGAANNLMRHIAAAIRKGLREVDVLARLEDDAFGVMLPDTSMQGAFWVGERIREQLLSADCRAANGSILNTNVVIGISGSRFDEKHSASDLYKMAQSRLFIARHSTTSPICSDSVVSLH
jgi:diguanylate cyclase (GGDEF)-like protein/PAS domain S-box-containing protein